MWLKIHSKITTIEIVQSSVCTKFHRSLDSIHRNMLIYQMLTFEIILYTHYYKKTALLGLIS